MYYQKYVKYKTKYLKSKMYQSGGNNNNSKLVVHICGPSGSGKTTLGNKLQEKYGDKIVVKDIDDLRAEFIEEKYGGYKKMQNIKNFIWDKKAYQKWIDNYVEIQTKPLIFVGLNHMPWWNKKLYYNMHSIHNYYIKMNSDDIFKQKCNRFFNDVFIKNRENVIKDIIENENDTIEELQRGLKHECGYNEVKKMNNMWDIDYKKQGYTFMSREDIFNEVSKLINNYLIS
jgi:adenylate kinase family enzyme